MATDKNEFGTATPEQIAAFDAILNDLSAVEASAVRRVWKAAQEFGYKTASKRVFTLIPAGEPVALVESAPTTKNKSAA
jgi:hypothetical protein